MKEQIKERIIQAIKENGNQEITGPVLQETLLAIVDDVYAGLGTIPIVAQELGSSDKKVISQRVATDAINAADKILPFDGFVEDATILNQSNPYTGGKIYFVKSANRFAYYREEDGIYTALWNDYFKYATIVYGEGVIPNSGVIFTFNNLFYRWSGESLTEITANFVIIDDLTKTDADSTQGIAPSPKAVKDYVNTVFTESKEIPGFNGIINDIITVINDKAYGRGGAVYFVKKAIMEGAEVQNIFVYKVRDAYYRSWYNESLYINVEKRAALENKLFEFEGKQYIYCDSYFGLLKDVFKTKWEEF